MWAFLAVTLGAAIVQGLSALGLTYWIGRAHERLVAELRVKLQAHVISLPLVFHESSKTGSLVSTIMMDVEGFPKLFSAGVVEAGGSLLGGVIAFGILLRIQPSMAWASLVLIVIHTLLSQRALQRIRRLFQDHQRTKAEVMGRLTETLSGVRLIKAYRAEQHESRVFSEGARRIFEKYVAAMMTTSTLQVSSLTITGAGSALVLFFGAQKVLAGQLTVGGLVTFSVILALLMAPINQIAGLATQLAQAWAGAERTLDLFDNVPEDDAETRTVRLSRLAGDIRFEHVTFGYDPSRPVLHNVSFEAEPGSVTALVGRSGAGKSTIAALIASLYTPNDGRVTIDGVDLSTVNYDSYRVQIGMVLQDTFLFDGTVYDNVAFCRLGVSEADIMAACRMAHVDEFAEQLPGGYRCIVGERGVKLSGGQRQRIAIARALLVNPRILILDEPTSNLDAYSEELVLDALRRLMAGKTTFLISHRMSLVRFANQILVVDAGRVVERGTHEDLIRARGAYFALAAKTNGFAGELDADPDDVCSFSVRAAQTT